MKQFAENQSGSSQLSAVISVSYLDADVVYGDDGLLQRGEAALVQRLSHHHFGCHVDEVDTDCF